MPDGVRTVVLMLATQLHLVNEQILELDRAIKASAKATEVDRRPVAAARLVGRLPFVSGSIARASDRPSAAARSFQPRRSRVAACLGAPKA